MSKKNLYNEGRHMNRMLVALSAVCLPMLSLAAPPITEPVEVTVANPVLQVEVSNADPVPVTIGEPVRFQEQELLVIAQGSFSEALSLFNVPAGKTAIVKFASGRAVTSVDSFLSCEVVQMSGSATIGNVGSHQVLVQKRPRIGVGDYWHDFSQEMELYVEGGRGAGLSCHLSPASTGPTGTIVSFTLTGIVVDAQ